MGVGPLCRLFGKSRQAYYEHIWHLNNSSDQEDLAVEMVRLVRRDLPGLGGHKLYKCLYTPFRNNGINMGRDKLYNVLRKHKMLIDRKKRPAPGTTNSNHAYLKYPNLIKNFAPTRSNELWVSDITYISVGYDFNYLSLITDAYSRKIMGYCLHPHLSAQGAINALKMALQVRPAPDTLKHHSDRGVQYCSFEYTLRLKKAGIKISITENGEAYENPIAERINGILKTEFKLKRVFASRSDALIEVTKSIESYNHLRPHMSCNYLTSAAAHTAELPLVKRWKNCRKKFKLIQKNQ
jgi:putative transposase